MKRPFENRVILFGGDEHNTLNVLRCLHRSGCDVLVLIHARKEPRLLRIAHSRCLRAVEVIREQEETAVEWLLTHADPEKKQLVIPASDFAAYVLDNNPALRENYIFQGFRNDPGRVVWLMDKFHQQEYALEHGFPMARTWTLQLTDAGFAIPDDVVYPCILKPQVSAFGSKSDICTAENRAELEARLREFRENGYRQLLMQQYLKKEYEALAMGCIVDRPPYHYFGVVHKLREGEALGGSMVYGRLVREAEVEKLLDRIVEQMRGEGFRGIYDIELLVCSDGIYLNEINYRNGGSAYMLSKNGMPLPYINCRDMLGMEYENWPQVMEGFYGLDEESDLFNWRYGRTSLGELISAVVKAKSFAKFDLRDLPGAWVYYKPILAGFLRKLLKVKKDQ